MADCPMITAFAESTASIYVELPVIVGAMFPRPLTNAGWETQPLRTPPRYYVPLDYLVTIQCQQNLVYVPTYSLYQMTP